MRCQTARGWITRDLAGELSPGRAGRLAQHVEGCEGCRREQTAYAALDRMLGTLTLDGPLPPRLEQDTLRRVRLAAADDDGPERLGVWRWLRVGAPALAGAAVLLLAVRAVQPPVEQASSTPPAVHGASKHAAPAPAPAQRATRRHATRSVPSQPPPELAARPDLFVNLPVLRNMEKLQHYEAIQTTTLDGQHDGQSSG